LIVVVADTCDLLVGLFSIPIFDDFFQISAETPLRKFLQYGVLEGLTKQVVGEIWEKWQKSGDWK